MPRTGPRGPNKRAKGDGSIFQVTKAGPYGPRKYWTGQVQAGHYLNGKRRYVTVTRKTKREVLAEMDALKHRASVGIVGPDQTVSDVITAWLATKVAAGKSRSTITEYRNRARLWVNPHIGNIRVRKLTRNNVRQMMAALKEQGLSPRSVNLAKSLLWSALEWA